jgi:gliding motility-associated-like protein
MKRNFFLFSFTALFVLLIASQKTNATHLVGGELVYTYIGDSTNIPNQYRIDLVLHRSTRWTTINLATCYNVCVRSSCFPNMTVQVCNPPGSPSNGIPVPNQTECVEISDPAFTPVFQHSYTGVVTLPGTCSDIKFSHSMVCCRIDLVNITNYSGFGAGGSTNYLEASLNNTLGQNTSPQFLTAPAKSFCVNNFFTWSQATVEPNNDSIEYSFGTAMNGASCGPGHDMIFTPPYSQNQPIATAAGTNIVIRPSGGVFEFTTGSIQGNFIVVVIVTELRLHPTGNFYYQVGTVMREMLINIVGNCLASASNGPTINTNLPGFYNDVVPTSVLKIIGNNYPIPNADSVPDPNSPTGYSMLWPVVEYPCFDSIITLEFSTNVQCNSITPTGSEFRIVGPDSNLVPVTHVTRNCNAALETTSIHIHLFQPLAEEGDYFMYVKEGTDGNTILNSCGFPLTEFFALIIRVDSCPNPLYDLKNISVINNDHIEVSWETDATSFPLHAVNAWHFFRSDDQGISYKKIANKKGPNIGHETSWIDYSVDNDDVNSQSFRYYMQMEAGGKYFMFTRDITSILLEKGQGYAQNGNYPLEWNHYDGWISPEYNLMIWDIDSGGWSMVNQPGNPTTTNGIFFNYNLISHRRGNSFALRIDGKNPGSTGINYTAQSNYIYISVPLVPPPPPKPPLPPHDVKELVIPNIFTPNGDGKNDVFAITGIEGFQSAEVTITNRWGNVVFRDDNFKKNNKWDGRDMRTGQMVSDGAYFYIIRLRGSVLGKPDVEETGSLTIFGAGSR